MATHEQSPPKITVASFDILTGYQFFQSSSFISAFQFDESARSWTTAVAIAPVDPRFELPCFNIVHHGCTRLEAKFACDADVCMHVHKRYRDRPKRSGLIFMGDLLTKKLLASTALYVKSKEIIHTIDALLYDFRRFVAGTRST